jgi:hypothetical protein
MRSAPGHTGRPPGWGALAALACLSAVVLSVAACGPTTAQVMASRSILERHERERQRCMTLLVETYAGLNQGMAQLQQGDFGGSQSLMGSAQTRMADAKAARIPLDVFAKVEKQWTAQHESGSRPK